MNVVKPKPPDEYRTVKSSLKSVIRDESTIARLFDAVVRTHKIVIHAYQFLRLWVLSKYHSGQQIPLITDSLVHMAIKSLLLPTCGQNPKGDNGVLYTEFSAFYTNISQLSR